MNSWLLSSITRSSDAAIADALRWINQVFRHYCRNPRCRFEMMSLWLRVYNERISCDFCSGERLLQ